MAPATKAVQPLKLKLVALGISNAEVSRKAGVGEHHVGRVLNGLIRPSAELVARFSEIIGEPAGPLLRTGDDDAAAAAVTEFVERTTAASGVPKRLEDEAAIEKVASTLRAATP